MSWLSDAVGKIPVVGGAINSVAHNVVDPLARSAVSAIPGGSAALGIGDALGQMVPGGAKDALGGAAGELSSLLSQDQGGINPLILGLAGAQGVNAAQLGAQSNQYAKDAMQDVRGSYDSRAGLRSQGIAQLLNPQERDTSQLSGIRQQIAPNPQAADGGVLRTALRAS